MKKIKDIMTRDDKNSGVFIARFIFENGWALSCRLDRWSTEVAVFNPEGAWMSATVFKEVFGRSYDYCDTMNDRECVVKNVTSEELEQLANYIADINTEN